MWVSSDFWAAQRRIWEFTVGSTEKFVISGRILSRAAKKYWDCPVIWEPRREKFENLCWNHLINVLLARNVKRAPKGVQVILSRTAKNFGIAHSEKNWGLLLISQPRSEKYWDFQVLWEPRSEKFENLCWNQLINVPLVEKKFSFSCDVCAAHWKIWEFVFESPDKCAISRRVIHRAARKLRFSRESWAAQRKICEVALPLTRNLTIFSTRNLPKNCEIPITSPEFFWGVCGRSTTTPPLLSHHVEKYGWIVHPPHIWGWDIYLCINTVTQSNRHQQITLNSNISKNRQRNHITLNNELIRCSAIRWWISHAKFSEDLVGFYECWRDFADVA